MVKKKIIFSAIFLLLAFLFTASLVQKQSLNLLDTQITIVIQSFIGRSLDVPLSFLSLLGSSEVIMLVLLLLAVVVYFRWRKIFYGLGLIVLVYFLELVGKLFIYHPGPPKEFFRYDLPFIFPSSYIHTNYSFPSGHVSRAAFILVILAFLIKRPIFYILYSIFFVLMFLSRIYLGEHWFSDVLGGTFLGSSLGLLSTIFL